MFVVTLPPSAAKDPRAFAERAKEAGANILEIRGDLTPDVEPFHSPLPLMLSPRSEPRLQVSGFRFQYLDLEGGEQIPLPKNVSLIRSFHDYGKTPSLQGLQDIAKKLMAMKPDIIKIATMVNSYEDLQTLDVLHECIPQKQKRIILGMGVRAHLNRMLSPFKNTLTYTYLDGDDGAVPGQVPLSLHKITEHIRHAERSPEQSEGRSRSIKIYGLLGGLEVKSFSPQVHNTLFRAHHIDALFTTFLTDNLDDAWGAIEYFNVQGCSITSPWKQKIISYLNALEEEAKALGSVNTIVKQGDTWVGYMRDTVGMIKGYPFLNEARSAAILGSGGVVPAIIHVCRKSDIKDIRIFARNEETRKKFEERFSVRSFPLTEAPGWSPDLLFCAINTDVSLPLPEAKENAHALDLRYGKETQFLKDAREKGYQTHDGVPMLLHQALAQFQLFSGTAAAKDDLQLLESLFSLL